jgi:histidinol-phosphate aminotransferase
MSHILELARPDIRELQPYQHAAWDPALERLHANEMPWRATADSSAAGLNRYPEPQPQALVQRLAELYRLPASHVLVGRGSDEAIDLLVRAFCCAGVDRVVICPPTFGFYQVAARIQGAAVAEVPLRQPGFGLDVDGVLAAAAGAKIVFLCSPTNPTGNLLADEVVLHVVEALARTAVVCVDEAYIEFSGRAGLTAAVTSHPNLVVLRTLSKAYALAGARCGSLLAQPAVVELLKRIIPPYAISTMTIEDVLRCTAAAARAEIRPRIETVLGERERLRSALERCSAIEQVHRSDANFLLVRCRDAARVFEAGRRAGLLVRDFSADPRLERCLRISVGTPEQNARLLAAVIRA